MRPFKIGDVNLGLAADKDGLDLNDRMKINKYLKTRVDALIEEANKEFEERNADSDEIIVQDSPSHVSMFRVLAFSRSGGRFLGCSVNRLPETFLSARRHGNIRAFVLFQSLLIFEFYVVNSIVNAICSFPCPEACCCRKDVDDYPQNL